MYKFSLLFLLLIYGCSGFGQDKKDTTNFYPDPDSRITTINFNKINQEIIFPLEAVKKNIFYGTVYCVFKINKDGKLYEISIEKSSNELFNKYAVRYLENFTVEVNPEQVGRAYSIKLIFKIE